MAAEHRSLLPKEAKKGSGAEETNYYWCRGFGSDPKVVTDGRFQCSIYLPDGSIVVDGEYILKNELADKPINLVKTYQEIQKVGYDGGLSHTISLNNGQTFKAVAVTMTLRDNSKIRMRFENGNLVEMRDISGIFFKR